uniref:Uncharacterized protein n=1 Tax=Schistocephalus solidus TaxID=70667 RepID=A0A0X3NX27_SCHSO
MTHEEPDLALRYNYAYAYNEGERGGKEVLILTKDNRVHMQRTSDNASLNHLTHFPRVNGDRMLGTVTLSLAAMCIHNARRMAGMSLSLGFSFVFSDYEHVYAFDHGYHCLTNLHRK